MTGGDASFHRPLKQAGDGLDLVLVRRPSLGYK